jgi:holo-[acyl-carrier protein] synthase
VDAVVTVVTGLDVQSIEEVEASLTRFGDRYLRRIYSEREVAECETNRDMMARSLALRFAAKEAVLKTLEPHDHIPPWHSIEVIFGVGHTPSVLLSGEARSLAHWRGIENLHLSVAFGPDYAVAVVVADVVPAGSRIPLM